MRMIFNGKSDVGRVRHANQDSFVTERLSDGSVLLLVCDGMGGAKSGNVASECAVEAFAGYLREAAEKQLSGKDDICDTLLRALSEANGTVYKKSRTSSEFEGMGTTLVAALIKDGNAYVINVGDSRLYLLTEEEIAQVSHDHSYVQNLVDCGAITAEEALTHPYRNRITRAVGVDNYVEGDLFSVRLSDFSDCYLLLCSDGLSGQLSNDVLHSIVTGKQTGAEDPETDLAEKVNRLIDSANEAGGPDNITAVLARYLPADASGSSDVSEPNQQTEGEM